VGQQGKAVDLLLSAHQFPVREMMSAGGSARQSNVQLRLNLVVLFVYQAIGGAES
jgi:hypothetical protein